MSDLPAPILDQPLEFTPNGIPVSLRPFFQEYVLEKLDPERDAFTVIERTLAWGDVRELHWLFQRFDSARLKAFVEKYGARLLPRRRARFWALFFQVPYAPRKDRIWKH
ncbi:MAG: hypothetical protein HY741_19270 [Chloroflexi bacterium]|nr:hypothetical protein [Chloroflexota bacterium]